MGLNEAGEAIKIASGLVGQDQAREAAGIVVDLIKVSRTSGSIDYLTILTPNPKCRLYLCLVPRVYRLEIQ